MALFSGPCFQQGSREEGATAGEKWRQPPPPPPATKAHQRQQQWKEVANGVSEAVVLVVEEKTVVDR
jgi:hypothetical protein